MLLFLKDEVDCDMECETLLPQTVSNGHHPVYHYSPRYIYMFTTFLFIILLVSQYVINSRFFPCVSYSSAEHHEHTCPPDDSTLQLLDPSHHVSSQDLGEEGHFCHEKKSENVIQSMCTVCNIVVS